MKPGDFLKFGCHIWLIRGVHLGGSETESVIEIECLTHKPAWTGPWETHQLMFVPEILTRQCEILKAEPRP